jgi:signal transduction histidine kinase
VAKNASLAPALANLLDNARRHAAGRIELTVGTDQASQLEIRLADDGPGLPLEMAERAFERFVSLDGKGGTGLGLAIARELARAHGGELSYQGGAFVLRLPMRLHPSGEPELER